MDLFSESEIGKLIKISQGSSSHCSPGMFFYTTNRYPLPTTVSMYPSPIFLLSEHIMLATAAPQCSKVLFPSSSVYTIKSPGTVSLRTVSGDLFIPQTYTRSPLQSLYTHLRASALIRLITFVTAAPQCSGGAFHTSS